MVRSLDILDFLHKADDRPIVDVRSPGEFSRGHIPGACSLPLFSNEERERVGICYKNEGHDAAVMLGLEIVGPKMRPLGERLIELADGANPLLHCWRGGMRSQSVGWLAEQVGLEPEVLTGGYKSYRRLAHADFERHRPIIVLSGMTGAGKTTMLKALQAAGEQVVDLEALANHRGSSFGGLGLPDQPTCEQFENELFEQLRRVDRDRPVWLEDESPSIGKVRVPDTLWSMMRRSPAIVLDVSREQRSRNLVEEYGALDRDGLQEATSRLERRLGGQRVKELLSYLDDDDLYKFAFELLAYYDKTYLHAATKKKPRKEVYKLSGEITVDRLIAFSREKCAA